MRSRWLASTFAVMFACSPPPTDSSPEAKATAEASWGWAEFPDAAGDPRRGEYLATIGACKECHTLRAPDGGLDPAKLFAGGIPLQGPWGVVATANVSTVAAVMPRAQLEDMIRGRLAFKYQMPTDLYQEIAADDMRDLIAYLRTLRPISRAPSENVYAAGFTPPAPNPILPITPRAPTGTSVERGRYLTTIAICKDCHSPRAADGHGYDERHLFAGGGIAFRSVEGRPIYPRNLTPDRATGLGDWSDAEITRAIRQGISRDGHVLNPAMPYRVALYALSDADLQSIILYLRSLLPVRRALPDNPRWSPGDPPDACCFPVSGADLERAP